MKQYIEKLKGTLSEEDLVSFEADLKKTISEEVICIWITDSWIWKENWERRKKNWSRRKKRTFWSRNKNTAT